MPSLSIATNPKIGHENLPIAVSLKSQIAMLETLPLQLRLGLLCLLDVQAHLDRVNSRCFENIINFFKRQAGGFGEDEVCEDELDGIVDDEDNPDLVAHLVDTNGYTVIVNCACHTLDPVLRLAWL